MEKFIIKGGTPLRGEVQISGAKNAAVAIIPAAILAEDKCVLENVPSISDVDVALEILSSMGAQIRRLSKSKIEVDTSSIKAEKNSRLDSCADTLCHCRVLWRLSDLSSLECETAGAGVRKTPAGRDVKCCNRDGYRRAGDRGEHRRNSDLL